MVIYEQSMWIFVASRDFTFFLDWNHHNKSCVNTKCDWPLFVFFSQCSIFKMSYNSIGFVLILFLVQFPPPPPHLTSDPQILGKWGNRLMLRTIT